jgi:hypothetical protein
MIALALVGLLASAAPLPNPYLVEGKKLYSELKYAKAMRQLELALAASGDDAEQQAETLELLGRCQIAERRLAEAEETFVRLLKLKPTFRVANGESPKISEVVDAARARVQAQAPRPVVPAPAPVAPKAEPAEHAPAAVAPAVAPPPAAEAVAPAPGSTARVMSWVAGAAALASTGAGIALSVRSQQLALQAHDEPWVDTSRNLQASAHQLGLFGVGFYVGAALAAALAVATWLL